MEDNGASAPGSPAISTHKRSRSNMSLSRLSTFRSSKHGDKEHSHLSPDFIRGDSNSAAASASGSPTTTSHKFFNSSPTNQFAPSTDTLVRTPSHMSHKSKAPSITGSLGVGSSSSFVPSIAPQGTMPAAASSAASIKGMSIEDSVRMFRLFEALRNGDTALIFKTIRESSAPNSDSAIQVHSVLQLGVQCAETQVVQFIMSSTSRTPEVATEGRPYLDINYRDPVTGNTALHYASQLGRAPIVTLLLSEESINDAIPNAQGMQALDLARTADIAQALQLARSIYLEEQQNKLNTLLANRDYEKLETFLEIPRTRALLDLNTLDGGVPGSTLLHEAAKNKDTRLIQILLLHGADPFRRDKKGKLPQDTIKDDKVRGVLKKSPAAVAAQQSIQEKAVLGSAAGIPGAEESGRDGLNKEGREMKGYLKKWTNYTGGYKLRWFVLENGVLSYYKHQDDTQSACRGAINMKIASLHADAQDKQRFEIHGKSSVRYHLKANHQVEAKRWIWALNSSIRYAKDEEKNEQHRKDQQHAKLQGAKAAIASSSKDDGYSSGATPSEASATDKRHSKTYSSVGRSGPRFSASVTDVDEDLHGEYVDTRTAAEKAAMDEDDDDADDDEGFDDSSLHSAREEPHSLDSLNLTAHSARLQLDLLAHVCGALTQEGIRNPQMPISSPNIKSALTSYDSAVKNLKSIMNELLKMSRERDAYWRYRLDKEIDLRNMWEENMTRLAVEQEALEGRMGEVEEKRKRTKRALREALRDGVSPSAAVSERPRNLEDALNNVVIDDSGNARLRKKSFAVGKTEVSDSESEAAASDEEFFDAIEAGEVEIVREMPKPVPVSEPPKLGPVGGTVETILEKTGLATSEEKALEKQLVAIKSSFKGYESPPRFKFDKAADDRPKISLWGILKSMIGKDMTKMTLPVSFNECTSLLQRVAEDMEYTDLLDTAASRTDSTERLVYVAAFAASEYASTINRVAKPFNPLLGETYEYCRPDKNFRFFIEQVSHHPPIGAAWAESAKWEYWGESSVRSKFYGKSFDINPLGTWFLKIRPDGGGPEEFYTWKKVNTAVVGIITGSPTVDNYGTMVVKNHTTKETCTLEFKARGWRGAGAFEVKGRVVDATDTQRWSIGGRWNDKLYARLSPGYDAAISPSHGTSAKGRKESVSNAAFLVWEVHERPPAPFNLTPFAISLNYLPDDLRPHLCPTDTRLRPDQRAMEDGAYDLAATEKNRLEEKQRARRREREQNGEDYIPRWFTKARDPINGEEFWQTNGEYWEQREKGTWDRVEDIFNDVVAEE